jgi:hypothetical protein
MAVRRSLPTRQAVDCHSHAHASDVVTIKGETRHRSAAPGRDTALYPVASCEAHHDAIIRILGEAPQWRSHSKARCLNAMAGIGVPPPMIIIIDSPSAQCHGRGRDEFRLRLD